MTGYSNFISPKPMEDFMKQYNFIDRWLIVAMSFFFTSILSAQQYDIYFFDINKGTNKKITNGADANLFNATWSTNGKKIAYDLVGALAAPFEQSIFISDVPKGTRTPLLGAEGGNDPAWSPDGEE